MKTGLGILLGENLIKKEENSDKKNFSSIDKLPISNIFPDTNQPRKIFNKEALKELAESIQNQGLLVPIIVRKDDLSKSNKYKIIAGERRWRASKIAGLKEIDVIISDSSEKDTALNSLIENVQREDLSPLEEAEGYNKLTKKHNMKHEEISKYTGKSRSYITNLIRIIGLPKEVKTFLAEEKISFGHARALLNSTESEKIAKIVIKENLSVRETEAIVKSNKTTKDIKTNNINKKLKDTNILDYEKYLSIKLGYKVQITDRKGKGKISVSYSNLDQLEEIIKYFND